MYLSLNIMGHLRSPEFIGAEPVVRATWIGLMAYCAQVENGGRIEGAGSWGERRWMQQCGVTLEEVSLPSELYWWDGPDLIVWGYNSKQEEVVRAKREGAIKANAKRWGQRSESDSESESESDSESDSVSDSEKKRKEKKEKVEGGVGGDPDDSATDSSAFWEELSRHPDDVVRALGRAAWNVPRFRAASVPSVRTVEAAVARVRAEAPDDAAILKQIGSPGGGSDGSRLPSLWETFWLKQRKGSDWVRAFENWCKNEYGKWALVKARALPVSEPQPSQNVRYSEPQRDENGNWVVYEVAA